MPDFSVSIVTKTVGYGFDPTTIAGPPLTGISWNNTTNIPHQILIVQTDGNFETPEIAPGDSSKLFVIPGDAKTGSSIAYSCPMHDGEVGSIFVSEVVNLNPEDPA